MAKQKETRERYEQHSFDVVGNYREPRRIITTEDIVRLHEALEPFISLPELRRCVAERQDIYQALRVDAPPKEVRAMMETLAAMLRPVGREQIKRPTDAAGFLMVQLGALDHEEFWTVLLDTKNRVIKTHQVYKGALDRAMSRVGEVFKEAIKCNAAALIASHNHPSTDCTPSPEDVLITRELVAVGKLLETDFLDHIIVSHSSYVSLRERGFGFDR
jgi:DNA repair protein RadC